MAPPLPFVEYKESAGSDEGKSCEMVPFYCLSKIESGERDEDQERNDFLHRLEFSRRVNGVAAAVGGDGEAVFNEGDAPACQNHCPQRPILEFQVAIPGKSHEDVGNAEKHDWHAGGVHGGS